MTDASHPAPPASPYVTGEAVAAHLGGTVDPASAEMAALAATMAVWVVVTDPGWVPDDPDLGVPAGVQQVTLMVAAELVKAGQAPGGEYQLDAYATSSQVITSNLVRKYLAVLAPWSNTGTMIG